MLKVTINGVVYPFNNDRYPLSDAIALEEKLGMPFYTWRASLDAGSAKALAGFVWLVLKRNGQDTPFEDIVSGAYDVASSDIEIEEEGGEDPTSVPSPGDGSSTSESSPSDSGSGPGNGTS